MNRPDNNTVQAGQLNHVQACQQAKSSIAFVRVDGFLNMNLNINFQTWSPTNVVFFVIDSHILIILLFLHI